MQRVGGTAPAEVFSGVIQPQTGENLKAHFLIQPGWQNSGPHHWQTLWEAQLGNAATRVPQRDWMVPERDAWTGVLEQTIRRTAPPVVILAHSIGCIATIFAVQTVPVAAVVLVAPADAERANAPGALHTFTPIPMEASPHASPVGGQRQRRVLQPGSRASLRRGMEGGPGNRHRRRAHERRCRLRPVAGWLADGR